MTINNCPRSEIGRPKDLTSLSFMETILVLAKNSDKWLNIILFLMNKLSKKIKIFLKKKNKIILLYTIVGSILIVVSFYSGAYIYHHKIFPFGASKKIV